MSIELKSDWQTAIQGTYVLMTKTMKGSQKALEVVGDSIIGAASEAAPVKTGRLRASIGVKHEEQGLIVIGADAPYAGFVNGGTRKMAARPFFTNALTNATQMFPLVLASEVGAL